ncbi:MAG: ImmA/IrrE family metallo-endopeptidase [Acidobacteria bacterium]|nr:ImmA/IrrE family metallo-endopeptidase [Acidobacteriota bacterium]
MENRTTAETFPPGEFIRDELEARGWSQDDLAQILGRQISVVNALIKGKRTISPDLASDLGAAFGTSAELWMNLETAYQLFINGENDKAVAVRAMLFEKAPIKEMVRRNWIEPTQDWSVLQDRLLNFLGIRSIDEQPVLAHAAKKSTSYGTVTPSQGAWLARAKQLGETVHVNSRFSLESFAAAIRHLKQLLEDPAQLSEVPRILASAGVRLLVIENIAHSKIDGACLWLDDTSPVIILSLRYDRLDHAWYLIMHEGGHVHNGDGKDGRAILDLNLVGDEAQSFEDKSEIEKQADIFAENALIDRAEFEDWISRTKPLYSKAKIVGFARRVHVHPALVLGQLQHRNEVMWSHSREMLVKARHFLTSTALTDGFGQVLSVHLEDFKLSHYPGARRTLDREV